MTYLAIAVKTALITFLIAVFGFILMLCVVMGTEGFTHQNTIVAWAFLGICLMGVAVIALAVCEYVAETRQ